MAKYKEISFFGDAARSRRRTRASDDRRNRSGQIRAMKALGAQRIVGAGAGGHGTLLGNSAPLWTEAAGLRIWQAAGRDAARPKSDSQRGRTPMRKSHRDSKTA